MTTGTNNEGYDIALNKAFDSIGDIFKKPFRSALSTIRKRISYVFVKDKFDDLIADYKAIRPTYKGYFLYSIDGDEYFIPPSEELLEAGFRGYPWSKKSETYNLKMYNVMAVDPMTGVPSRFSYSYKRNEIALAAEMIETFEKNSICIYDRLYFSFKMVLMHKWSNNYFLFRCKKGSTLKAIVEFAESSLREQTIEYAGVKIRLIKQKNRQKTEDNIFATNLPDKDFNNKEIQLLYFRRWESETSNRDLSCTLKMEQFHSSSLNGILQEIYMRLWYMAFSKIQIMKEVTQEEDFLSNNYQKANCKEAMIFIINHIPDLILEFNKKIYEKLKFIINRSIVKRKRLKRSYPRQIKSSRSRSYINASTVPKR